MFAASFMKCTAVLYTLSQKIPGILMMLVLGWLTVSLPYINEAQHAAEKISTQTTSNKDSSINSPANTTEEKTTSTNTFSEEYLHHLDEHFKLPGNKSDHYNSHSYDVYVAFHGELLSPPPDVS